ncbi:DVUA0089 family protein [Synechocystis sp. PCC 7509]|uniref:DVUA0089 family protein n=1 Tax=Synechocystis sp. PCC 7509 TaxID=927677 RepID=UPI0002AC0D20|nr:DVUA0089 family protein [Synechocystis sp. PCC 7509]
MKQFISAIPVLLAVVYAGQAQAVTFAEISDAGDNLNTAQVIPSGAFSLDSISGTLFENDADLFKIFLTGGQTFSATTRNAQTDQIPIDDLLGIPTELAADPQLFLFDSAGRGVYANDDSFGSLQPTLSSSGFSPTEAGIYYLAISSSGYNPVSNGTSIFPDATGGEVLPNNSNFVLTDFVGTSNTNGRYDIALSGAKAVPEPTSILGILSLSAWGAVRRMKKKVKQ